MTLGQAYNEGYTEGRTSLQRGYTSRKKLIDNTTHVYKSGKNGTGALYYIKPCFISTNYSIRQYLKKV